MLSRQKAFIAGIEPDFEHCHREIEATVQGFLSEAGSRRQQLSSEFFQALTASADEAISTHFGDQPAITRALERAQEAHHENQSAGWTSWSTRAAQHMNEDLQRSTKRLMEDVARREVQLSFTLQHQQPDGGVATTALKMDLSLKDWASTAMSIGGYALSGFTTGSAFPGIGNVIGTIVGTLVGAIKAVMDFVAGKAERVREAQRQLHARISSLQSNHEISLKEAQAALVDQVRGEITKHLQRPLEQLLDTLNKPQGVLVAQIALLANTKSQLEKMPHGSIRSIQH